MSTTLTLKNIPDAIYTRLKRSAEIHHRSLNGEAIVCLERILLPHKLSSSDRLDRVRQLRATLKPVKFKASDIDLLKREERA